MNTMIKKDTKKIYDLYIVISVIAIIVGLVYFSVYKYINKQYNILHHISNDFGDIWIYDDENHRRCLSFSQPNIKVIEQTCINLQDINMPVFNYHKMLLSSLYINPYPKKILMLGLGGGAIAHYIKHLAPNYVQFDIVEIDPDVINAAENFFFLKADDNTNIIHEDAYNYVNRIAKSKQQYDLIIIDLFTDTDIPEKFITMQFMKKLHHITANAGVIAINTFASSPQYDKISSLIFNVFGRFYNLIDQNRVAIAYNGTLPHIDLLQYNASALEKAFNKVRIDKQWLISKMVVYDRFID